MVTLKNRATFKNLYVSYIYVFLGVRSVHLNAMYLDRDTQLAMTAIAFHCHTQWWTELFKLVHII
jgi:hypothetical protein